MSMRSHSAWTTDVTDPPMNVLAVAVAVLVGCAVGVGKLEFSWYALAAPLPVTLAAAIALARSLPRAILAGVGGCMACLCIAVPLALLRAWASMF